MAFYMSIHIDHNYEGTKEHQKIIFSSHLIRLILKFKYRQKFSVNLYGKCEL